MYTILMAYMNSLTKSYCDESCPHKRVDFIGARIMMYEDGKDLLVLNNN